MDQQMSELETVQAALGAHTGLRELARSAELLDLVQAAAAAGWLDTLAAPATVQELADTGGVSPERARRVVKVFLAGGIVREVDGPPPAFVLTDGYAMLQAGPAGVRTDVALDAIEADRRRLRSALTPGASSDFRDDALVVAKDWGMLPTDTTRALFGAAYAAVPDYHDRLAAGGPLLDVGTGVGGALLATLTSFPALRAVGIERAGDVVEEVRERAEKAGVTSRVEIRHADAQDLDDDAVYAVCYWAQAFFPHQARATTLTAIRRALARDGLLLVQELVPPAESSPSARLGTALDALVADSRGTRPVMTAEELAAEMQAGGFTDVRVVSTAVGRLILGRKGD